CAVLRGRGSRKTSLLPGSNDLIPAFWGHSSEGKKLHVKGIHLGGPATARSRSRPASGPARRGVLAVGVLVRRHERHGAGHAGGLGGEVEVEAVEEVPLLDEHQELALGRPAGVDGGPQQDRLVAGTLAERENAQGAVIVVRRQADLLEVVVA